MLDGRNLPPPNFSSPSYPYELQKLARSAGSALLAEVLVKSTSFVC